MASTQGHGMARRMCTCYWEVHCHVHAEPTQPTNACCSQFGSATSSIAMSLNMSVMSLDMTSSWVCRQEGLKVDTATALHTALADALPQLAEPALHPGAAAVLACLPSGGGGSQATALLRKLLHSLQAVPAEVGLLCMLSGMLLCSQTQSGW